MDKRGWVMVRVFINRYHPKANNAFMKLLPPDDRLALLSEDITSKDLAPMLRQPQKALSRIHYSWIAKVIKTFPSPLQLIAASCLNSEQIAGLNVEFVAKVSPPIRSFMQKQIYDLLKVDEHLPLEYLPETDLSPLLNWNKSQLLVLIDYLGLHDLAFAVRQIVNRNDLKNIYTCLTPKQFYYLKICLQQKDKIISPKLPIDPSKIDRIELKKILHKRGLSRLGRAFYGLPADLVWHLAYQLDHGRGLLLLKDYQPEPLPKITLILRQQVINLMNFLKSD